MSSSLNFLGMIRKARRLEIGEEFTGAVARAGKARLILLASDAADNAKRRAANFAKQGNAPLIQLPYTRAELGAHLDKESPGMVTITDIGFASAFMAKFKVEVPGYDELAEELAQKAARAQKRKKATLDGKKSATMGKRRNKV